MVLGDLAVSQVAPSRDGSRSSIPTLHKPQSSTFHQI